MSTALGRAEQTLAAQRRSRPAWQANCTRNARAEIGRGRRWAPMRAAAWEMLAPCLTVGTRVAILGAGNGDTLPLEQITEHTRQLTLIDLDLEAVSAARRRLSRHARRRVRTIADDATAGAADTIARQLDAGEVPEPPVVLEAPLPGAPYDLVIGDLLYSQLLYPALLDLEIAPAPRTAILDRYGPALTRGLVARMHTSAPDGHILHIHDPAGWWTGHPQPVTLNEILTAAQRDPARALQLAAATTGPRYSDPRAALHAFNIPTRDTRLWHWPFAPGVEYLICATLAGTLTTTPEH